MKFLEGYAVLMDVQITTKSNLNLIFHILFLKRADKLRSFETYFLFKKSLIQFR